MKLILARHGETLENKQGILQGHLHGNLSPEGIEQAKKLAARLKEEKIDAIFSSDLTRASDTAKEIAKFHSTIPINFVKELKEKDQGSLTGKKESEIDVRNPPSGVETKESMFKRAKKILNRAYKKYPDGVMLFVAHGGILKRITELIFEDIKKDKSEIKNAPNASISVIDFKEDKNHKIILLNCEKHLR